MKLFPYCAPVLALITLLGSSGCKRAPVYTRTSGGLAGSSGDWQITAGTGHVEEGKPGVFFSTRQAPDGPREFSYLFIFRHAPNLPPASVNAAANSRSEDQKEFVNESVTIGDKKLDVALELARDVESKTYKVTGFKINGQATDLSKGKIFLVDFVTTPLSVKQIDAPLPTDLPKIGTPVDTKEMIERFLREITAASEEARTFVQEQK